MGGGQEPISKMEFRQHVRRILERPDVKPDVKQIDSLFERLDDDNSGAIDVSELRTALKRLQTVAATAGSDAEKVSARAESFRERARQAGTALVATQQMESAYADMDQRSNEHSLESRLGALLHAKSMKLGELMLKWDRSGDGAIDKLEFRSNVRNLGLEASNVELDELFAKLDEDGGGTLDPTEIKHALRSLQESAEDTSKHMRKLQKAAGELVKRARAEQAEMKRRKREDEAAEREAALHAENEAAERAAAAEAAKAAKLAEKAARAAAAMAEKEQFQAKVLATRRTKRNSSTAGAEGGPGQPISQDAVSA